MSKELQTWRMGIEEERIQSCSTPGKAKCHLGRPIQDSGDVPEWSLYLGGTRREASPPDFERA